MDIYTITTQDVLDRISRHCPDSMSTYLQCVNRANHDGTITFSKDMVEIDMSVGWTKFKNQIRKLALENLLEWHPFDGGISVTLADLDHESE